MRSCVRDGLKNLHAAKITSRNVAAKRFIRLTTGDRVKLQMSPYDIDKARIVYRLG
ncbi:MAG TPA: hypothetical protein VGI42_03845 [Chthoniobacterales bacterium]|jgi:translation initiation factor IF-1